MADLRDVKKKHSQRLSKYEKKSLRFKAFTGDHSDTVNVPGMPGFIYVRDWNGIVHVVYNNVAPTDHAGYVVEVAPHPNNPSLLMVIGMINPYVQGPDAGTALDPKTLEWPGVNTIYIHGPQIVPALVVAIGGMVIACYPDWMLAANGDIVFIPYVEVDLTSYIPASGALWAVVSDKPDGTVDVTVSATADSLLALINDPISVSVDPSYKSRAAVALVAGMTEVIQNADLNMIADLRWTAKSATGAISWGAIAGTLSNQTDLQSALDAKADIPPDRFLAIYNYFIGSGTPGYRIGLASSVDGRTWTIETEPIINLGTAGAWDDDTVQFPELLSVNGVLYCYYAGKDGATWANFKIGLAQSFDGGLTWTKHASNPLINNNIAWENTNIFSPVVLYDKEETDSNKRWKMWYAGSSFGQGIGYAYSADGITWTKSSANPVMTPGSGWEDTYIGPKAVIRRGDEFILFFAGRTGAMWQNGIATFTDPEGTYTRGANNPILGGDGITTTLTANLTVGSTTAAVADATIFPIGCPVWISDDTNRFLTHVIKRNSSTSLELADAAPVTIVTTNSKVRSIAYNSIDITGVRYDDGYKFTITPHQPDGLTETGVHELSMLAYANDDLEAAYIDYSAGVQVPVTVAESQGTHVSRENWSLVDLQETEERHKPEGIPEAVVLFDDTEGNPADVTTGSALDGTSAFAARRDHVHHVEAIGVGELVMETGVTLPPVPLTNAEGDDWIYGTP